MLEKAGFRREGLLRSYLRINGIWQDHYLYARIADDPPGDWNEGRNLTNFLRNRSLFAFVLAAIVTLCAASSAFAVEPIKIARDDMALDLSGAVEIYRNQGENFQVSTAPGADGIVRRIEVEANDARSTGDWAVFALANTTDQQLDRLIVAPHFRLVNSGIFWPDLGSTRIAAITPSEGFALDRQTSPDADVFRVTLNPGTVITFIAELASPKLPQVYLWDPEAYKDSVNSYTLFRGIVIGIAGLLALFLTILFVVKGTSMFPGDRGTCLGGACLYLRRFRLSQQGHRDIARQ